jgi:hypothetical protein
MTYSFEGYSRQDIQEARAAIFARLDEIDHRMVSFETEREYLTDRLAALQDLDPWEPKL